MRIKCLTTFLDGKDRFEKDDIRAVHATDTETAEQRASRFVSNGWAEADGVVTVEPASGSSNLNIQNGTHGVSVQMGD